VEEEVREKEEEDLQWKLKNHEIERYVEVMREAKANLKKKKN